MTVRRIQKKIGHRIELVSDESQHFTMGSWDGTIYMHPRYLPYLNGKLRKLPYWRKRQAKYVYFLAHEMGHISYNAYTSSPELEARINHWVANNYIRIARILGFSAEATKKLWNALPEFYREA